MAYPYSTTIPGLVAAIRQLRSAFPALVTAETLKKWSIASNNEGTVLVVLRFLGIIDEEGKKQPDAAKVFVEHDDATFAKKFEGLVKAAYTDLFESWADAAWTLERAKLIGFFRTADESSARVGQQQAQTFAALASIAGHGSPPAEAPTQPRKAKPSFPVAKKAPKGTSSSATQETVAKAPDGGSASVAMTVRVEINLPVTDDQAVYDKIFKSIRANLIDA